MDQRKIESLTINELRTLAATLKLDSRGSRENILGTVIAHYNVCGWPSAAPEPTGGPSPAVAVHPSGLSPAGGSSEGESQPYMSDPSGETTRYESRIPTPVSGSSNMQNAANIVSIPDTQLIVETVMQALQRLNPQLNASNQIRVDAGGTRRSEGNNGGSPPVWQNVKCAEKLIPHFSGKDEENVVKWLDRIAGIALNYRFSNDVLLLATVSRLKDRALGWYNRQPLESVSTWEEFKFQLRRYFERKESYSATMSRISARVWKSHTEKFVEYAEAKLNLMQMLSLSEKEKIELLADGVKDYGLRRMVLNTWIDNVPDFIDHVRRITEDGVITRRGELLRGLARRGDGEKTAAATERTCFTCKKPGHLSKGCQIAKATCFRCGQTGHLSTTCPKREARQVAALSDLRDPVASSSLSTVPPTAMPPDEDVLQVGANSEARSYLIIRRVNNKDIAIRALIDTGSPVNLIKKSVYEKLLGDKELFRVKNENNYKGINESPLIVYGRIYDQITLDCIKDTWYDISLLLMIKQCVMMS